MRPVRLQLSRKKGFNLQAYSRAVNGLEAVNVARPRQHGNPWRIVYEYVQTLGVGDWTVHDPDFIPMPKRFYCSSHRVAQRFAVWKFRRWHKTGFAPCADDLRGKNLACHCAEDEPCHADVLLAIANQETVDG